MTDTTIPGLPEVGVVADNTYIAVRRNGQVSDEKAQLGTVLEYVHENTSINDLDDVLFESPVTGQFLVVNDDGILQNLAVSTGEANTASNLGGDTIGGGVFNSKSGADLRFNRIVAGSNVTISGGNSSNINISGAAPFSGDYGDLVGTPDFGDLALLDSVGTSNINNNAVTYAKIQELDPLSLLGNPTGGTTEVQAVSVSTVLSMLSVQSGATANDTDANLRNRATHTGTQPYTTITGLGTMATQNANAVAITGGTISGVSLAGVNQTTIATSIKTANHVAAASDAGTIALMNVATANTYTVPPNSSVNFPLNTMLGVTWYGVGQTTIVAGAGVTILLPATQSLVIHERYDTAILTQVDADVWLLTGAMELA